MWLDGSMTVDRLSFSGGSPLGKRGSFFARGEGRHRSGHATQLLLFSVDVDRESQVRSGLVWGFSCQGAFPPVARQSIR
jgi:hypothetical protein